MSSPETFGNFAERLGRGGSPNADDAAHEPDTRTSGVGWVRAVKAPETPSTRDKKKNARRRKSESGDSVRSTTSGRPGGYAGGKRGTTGGSSGGGPRDGNVGRLERFLRTAALASLAVYAAAALLVVADHVTASGRVYPGVRVVGQDLGGMSPVSAAEEVRQITEGGAIARYRFVKPGGGSFSVRARDLGVDLDVGGTAEAAYGVGRTGSVANRLQQRIETRLFGGLDSPPDATYRKEPASKAVDLMAKDVNRPSRDAAIRIVADNEGAPSVQRIAHIVGRAVNKDLTLENLSATLSMLGSDTALAVEERTPGILDGAARNAEAKLDNAIDSSIRFDPIPASESRNEDARKSNKKDDLPAPNGSMSVSPDEIARAVEVDPRPAPEGRGYIGLILNGEELPRTLEGPLKSATVAPVDARAYAEGDGLAARAAVEPSALGMKPVPESVPRSLARGLFAGDDRYTLPVEAVEPDLNTAEAEALLPDATLADIDVVAPPETAGDEDRKDVVRRAADAIDGIVVAPGDELSLRDSLEDAGGSWPEDPDPISGNESAGYGDSLVNDGGGTGQVASALHASAVGAGLGIEERHAATGPLAYVQPGLDAVVDAPTEDAENKDDRDRDRDLDRDLVVRNNSQAFIMIKAQAEDDGKVRLAIDGQRPADGGERVSDVRTTEIKPPATVPEGFRTWVAERVKGTGRSADLESFPISVYDPPGSPPEPAQSTEDEQEQPDARDKETPEGFSPDSAPLPPGAPVPDPPPGTRYVQPVLGADGQVKRYEYY